LFGLLLILASAVFWAFTQRESALMVGAGITLSTLGYLQRTFEKAQDRLPRYDQPPDDEFDREREREKRERERAERYRESRRGR
jgi:hypothetical protein